MSGNRIVPMEIWQLILDSLNLRSQLIIYQLCKIFNKRLKITNFYDIGERYIYKLTNDILKRYNDIKFLNIRGTNVTDEGIQHLKLEKLSTNKFITDNGIKYMTSLQYLNISRLNDKITDEGIKSLKLHTLYAIGDKCKITDEGIGGELKNLIIAYNPNITDNGIKVLKHFEVIKRFIFLSL